MPCDYKEYHPKWTLLRRMILRRAGHKCERCGIANGLIIHKKDRSRTPGRQEWDMMKSKERTGVAWQEVLRRFDYTRIVLTIAHIDHDKSNNKFWNLGAWCQKCHLSHDIRQHVSNRKYGRNHNRPHQLKIQL